MPSPYNILFWNKPSDGYACRLDGAHPLEFWMDSDGRFVTGGDPFFCHTRKGGDVWLTLENGSPAPSSLAGIPTCGPDDKTTPVRIIPEQERPPSFNKDEAAQMSGGEFTTYQIGLRCYRLLLAQNLMLSSSRRTCDFSRAVYHWLAPRENGSTGFDRPLQYQAGPAFLPSELADLNYEGALSPVDGGIGGSVYPSFEDGKSKWEKDPDTGMPTHRIPDPDGNPSMFCRYYWKHVGDEKERHDLYWALTSDSPVHVFSQLQSQSGLLDRVFPYSDGPAGVAFDLILLCKTYYWYKKESAIKVMKPDRHDPSKDYNSVYWVWLASGYYNTKVCGYLTHIVPVPPKERSAA